MLPGSLCVRNNKPKEHRQNKERKKEKEAIKKKKISEENFRHINDQIPDKLGNM